MPLHSLTETRGARRNVGGRWLLGAMGIGFGK